VPPLFMGSIYGSTNSYGGGLAALAVVAALAAVGAFAMGRRRSSPLAE
jgi:cyanate permease